MNTAKAVQKFSNYLEQSRKETYDGFLAGALLALDELTGEVVTYEVLNKIFDNFCIGK